MLLDVRPDQAANDPADGGLLHAVLVSELLLRDAALKIVTHDSSVRHRVHRRRS